MIDSIATASWYAYFRACAVQKGGLALVVIEIGEKRWDFLVSLGAVDSSPVSNMPGQTQAFVPYYLINLFNLLKTRFTFMPLPPGPAH